MKIKLAKATLKDIDDKVVKEHELHKSVANILYTKAKNLDLVDIAVAMNRGEAVEMAGSHIKELRGLVADPANGLLSFARKAVLDYLDKEIKPE